MLKNRIEWKLGKMIKYEKLDPFKEQKVSDGSRRFRSVLVQPDGEGLVAFENHNGGNVWASKDAGSSWTEVVVDDSPQYWVAAKKGTSPGHNRIIALTSHANTFVSNKTKVKEMGGEQWLSHRGALWESQNWGMTWYELETLNMFTELEMVDVAMSAQGGKIVATAWGELNKARVWSTTSGGAEWKEHIIGASHSPYVAMSENGTTIAIACGGPGKKGDMFISRDGGESWALKRPGNESRSWMAISMSLDGSTIVGAPYSPGAKLWISRDYGESWGTAKKVTGAGSGFWHNALALSGDGVHMAAASHSGSLWTSDDIGLTWEEQKSAGSRGWGAIDMSQRGHKIAAAVEGFGGNVWTTQRKPFTLHLERPLHDVGHADSVGS